MTRTFTITAKDLQTLKRWFANPATRYRFLRFLRERLVFAIRAQAHDAKLARVKKRIHARYKKEL